VIVVNVINKLILIMLQRRFGSIAVTHLESALVDDIICLLLTNII
jgi:hypothetical protein